MYLPLGHDFAVCNCVPVRYSWLRFFPLIFEVSISLNFLSFRILRVISCSSLLVVVDQVFELFKDIGMLCLQELLIEVGGLFETL